MLFKNSRNMNVVRTFDSRNSRNFLESREEKLYVTILYWIYFGQSFIVLQIIYYILGRVSSRLIFLYVKSVSISCPFFLFFFLFRMILRIFKYSCDDLMAVPLYKFKLKNELLNVFRYQKLCE